MYAHARLMAHIPDKVLADLRIPTLVTVLKGTFSADALSCNGCGISRFRGRIGQFALVRFVHTLFRRDALETSALKECCVSDRGQSQLTGSEISANW